MRRLIPLPALLLLAAIAAPGAYAGPGQSVSGTVTVTGTAGKDELRITTGIPSSQEFVVTPAATVNSTGGPCTPDSDPQTGRPVSNRCNSGSNITLILNLGGGDDNVTLSDTGGSIATTTANAGPGNDIISLNTRTPKTLNGQDGDDSLRITGPQVSTTPTTFDGGNGRDRAAFDGVVGDNGRAAAINGSLATNQVVIRRNELNGTQTNQRTETLISIEALEGTETGDVIVGGSAVGTELIGGEGPDNLTAGSADTRLDGGGGLDQLAGGGGIDTLDGGPGIDTYRGGARDTYSMRDGYAETAECVGGSIVINDLADAVTSPANCSSIQTAAAKHKHDTTISTRRLKIAPNGATLVRLKCPLRKAEPCVGVLRLRAGRRTLAKRSYLILQGTAKLLRFRLTRREAARAAAKKVEILGEEIDDDGRPRAVMRRVPARRKRA